jgi:N-acetylmuramoyl-L-alanine amidase
VNLRKHLNILQWLFVFFAIFAMQAQAAQTVTSARIWPAQDYTRITFESAQPFTYSMMEIKNPDRIVLDIENIYLDEALKTLSSKIAPDDPYIKQIRFGYYQQNITRMVVDLKAEAKPKAFHLPPAGEYQHRLVLDIFPLKDSLMSMLENHQPNATDASQAPTTNAAEDKEKPQVQGGEAPEVTTPTVPEKNAETLIKDKKSKVKEGRVIVIAIDAGHGGEDPGARGANGSHEKDITLKIAKKLKEAIDREPNMQGELTRDGDYFIPLHGRVVKARNLKADLFISIHADAFTNQAARGSSVFALSERGATSAGARYLAKKENESDLIGGVSLDDKDPMLARILLDLSQTATINDSLKLGKSVLGHIGKINRLHKNHVEQAGFAVLKSPDIPSILVETAFISNPEEEQKLNDDAYQDKLVESILAGIKKYFAANPALVKSKNAGS